MSRITKPKNVIPTVVLLDPAANRYVSRLQENNQFIQIEGQDITIATDEDIQNIIDDYDDLHPSTHEEQNTEVQENTEPVQENTEPTQEATEPEEPENSSSSEVVQIPDELPSEETSDGWDIGDITGDNNEGSYDDDFWNIFNGNEI